MAVIKPFKAVRPTRDKIHWVSCKALDVYSNKELKSKLAYNPFTFLHVVNPAYKFSSLKTTTTDEKRFQMVRNRYQEFKDDGFLLKEDKECLYIYKKVTPLNVQYCGIIAATSVVDFKNKTIRKHEETLKQREELFEYYLKNTGFNAEPVLLTYRDNHTIEDIIAKYTTQRPEYEFSSQDKNLHVLWKIDSEKDIEDLRKAFESIDTLFIADGHHRTTASLLLSEEMAEQNPKHTGKEEYNYFMSYLLPASQLKISAFNRFVKDLNGFSVEQFLIELDTEFKIENYGSRLYTPTDKNSFSMYLKGRFYKLKYRNIQEANSLPDSEILYQKVLKNLLGIEDIRSDERIHYSAHIHNPLELKTKVDLGEFAVSFGMKPISLKEVNDVVKQDKTLLPKTTYVEPKIRSAMLIHEW